MLTRSRTVAAPEAAGEIARMERASDTPRPTTAADTAPKADPTECSQPVNYFMFIYHVRQLRMLVSD